MCCETAASPSLRGANEVFTRYGIGFSKTPDFSVGPKTRRQGEFCGESHRVAHFFRGRLTPALTELRLLEGQDMVLAPLEEIRSGTVWSPKRQERRPLAPSLQRAVLELEREQGPH